MRALVIFSLLLEDEYGIDSLYLRHGRHFSPLQEGMTVRWNPHAATYTIEHVILQIDEKDNEYYTCHLSEHDIPWAENPTREIRKAAVNEGWFCVPDSAGLSLDTIVSRTLYEELTGETPGRDAEFVFPEPDPHKVYRGK